MSNQNLPDCGQNVNLILVHGGEIHVVDALVDSAGDASLTLSVNSEVDGYCSSGSLATIQYQHGGAEWRLKGVVSDLADARLEVEIRGVPSRGENRDFIRAQIEMPVYISALRATSLEDAMQEKESTSVSDDSDAWTSCDVDLSGNGAKLKWEGAVSKGDWVDFRIKLPLSTGDEIVDLLGRVVRVQGKPSERDVALHFEGIDEGVQDHLFDFVSGRYHAQIQVALSKLTHSAEAS